MLEVFKCGSRETENKKITLEVHRNGYIGLNTASCGYTLRKYTGRDT